jgi:hypothetical protein
MAMFGKQPDKRFFFEKKNQKTFYELGASARPPD